jgi:hypothetical protein
MTERPGLAAPWEARVFAIADSLREQGVLDWHDFQQRVAEVVPAGVTPTYEDWLTVLEAWNKR